MELGNLKRSGIAVTAEMQREVFRAYIFESIRRAWPDEQRASCLDRIKNAANPFEESVAIISDSKYSAVAKTEILQTFIKQIKLAGSEVADKYDEFIFRAGICEFTDMSVLPAINGRYQYQSYLGHGIEGVVFKILDLQTGEIKAVKFCFNEVTDDAKEWQEILLGREREVQLYEIERDSKSGLVWIVKEYVPDSIVVHRESITEAVAKIPALALLRSYFQCLEELNELSLMGVMTSDVQLFVKSKNWRC